MKGLKFLFGMLLAGMCFHMHVQAQNAGNLSLLQGPEAAQVLFAECQSIQASFDKLDRQEMPLAYVKYKYFKRVGMHLKQGLFTEKALVAAEEEFLAAQPDEYGHIPFELAAMSGQKVPEDLLQQAKDAALQLLSQ
ncbi:MAG: hypothetical protein D6698_07850 [Gammaproteobacteria bacterium]|nr:MAG: hypothetical protein D6698_07850 [Gammaproteobacteria bacterium]